MEIVKALYEIKDNSPTNLKESNIIEFLGHCFTNINETRSQNFQDIWALYQTNYKKNGFFVDFGATDGLTGSNTYILEKDYDWQGILCEPNPIWHDSLEKNRNAKIVKKCVYTKSNEKIEFIATNEPDLSTIKGYGDNDEHSFKRKSGIVYEVETISLYDLLEENQSPLTIDYMSVDTEGSEYDILKSYFEDKRNEKYKIVCISVEHNFSFARESIQKLLKTHGYIRTLSHFSRWDDFYWRIEK